MPAAPELRDVRREPRAAHVLRRRLARELAEPDRHVAPPCQQQREEEWYLTDEEPQAQAPDGVATGGEHVRVDQREERRRERELEPAERDAPDRRRHDGRRGASRLPLRAFLASLPSSPAMATSRSRSTFPVASGPVAPGNGATTVTSRPPAVATSSRKVWSSARATSRLRSRSSSGVPWGKVPAAAQAIGCSARPGSRASRP